MARWKSLITPRTGPLKCHVCKIEEEHRPGQGILQTFLESTHQPALPVQKVREVVITPPTCTSYKKDLDEQRRRKRRRCTVRHSNRRHCTRSTLSEGEQHGERNNESQRVPYLEERVVSLLESETAYDYKSRDLLKSLADQRTRGSFSHCPENLERPWI